jgi:hypothetical protein
MFTNNHFNNLPLYTTALEGHSESIEYALFVLQILCEFNSFIYLWFI